MTDTAGPRVVAFIGTLQPGPADKTANTLLSAGRKPVHAPALTVMFTRPIFRLLCSVA